jgi:uncharacterized membrane protein (UPF0127 family)
MVGMRRALLLLTVLFVVPACTNDPRTPPVPPGNGPTFEVVFHAALGDRSLFVHLADSPDERARGLMGVRDLPNDGGMAFAFGEPSTATFWMKDTLIPLSIAFVAQDGRIVTLANMAPCRAEPCPTYSARGPYTLAVEANAGWFRDHGVDEGDDCSVLGPA